MDVLSVNTINDNLEQYIGKYVYVMCYITYNQDIRAIHHVSTPEQSAHPDYGNRSAMKFDYAGLSAVSHSELSDINRNLTVVILGGTVEPFSSRGSQYNYSATIIATELKYYDTKEEEK